MNTIQLRAREIERLENTSIATAFATGAVVDGGGLVEVNGPTYVTICDSASMAVVSCDCQTFAAVCIIVQDITNDTVDYSNGSCDVCVSVGSCCNGSGGDGLGNGIIL